LSTALARCNNSQCLGPYKESKRGGKGKARVRGGKGKRRQGEGCDRGGVECPRIQQHLALRIEGHEAGHLTEPDCVPW
jgi:hypothetical protein